MPPFPLPPICRGWAAPGASPVALLPVHTPALSDTTPAAPPSPVDAGASSAQAEDLLHSALSSLMASVGATHRLTATAANNLGLCYKVMGLWCRNHKLCCGAQFWTYDYHLST